MSPDHEQVYREKVSTRATASGDAALAVTGNIPSFGVELVPVSLLDSAPKYCQNTVANTDGTTATALAFGPIDDLVLTPTSLAKLPIAAYVEGVDYSVNETAGTWTRLGGGAIGSGATIKATYKTAGRLVLTNPQNLIICIGRDVRIEKDRNIFKGVNEFAITHNFQKKEKFMKKRYMFFPLMIFCFVFANQIVFASDCCPNPPPCEPLGTGTPGYWKCHPEAWPVASINIGGVTYTKNQAILIMNLPVNGDKTITMFRALVAAILNTDASRCNEYSCIPEVIQLPIYGCTIFRRNLVSELAVMPGRKEPAAQVENGYI